MTIIVGILCDGGVVMGADGATTLDVDNRPTVSQKYTRKLEIIDNQLIVGCAGYVGLSQIYKAVLKELWHKARFVPTDIRDYSIPEFAMKLVQDEMTSVLDDQRKAQVTYYANFGIQPMNVSNATLLSIPLQHEPHLLSFTQGFYPEKATRSLPFYTASSSFSNCQFPVI